MNTYISNLPELIKEWHPSNNGLLDPNLLTSGSNKRVWWRCSNNQNHVWEALIYKRALSGRSCPYCAGKRVSIENSLATKYPEVSKLKREGLRFMMQVRLNMYWNYNYGFN